MESLLKIYDEHPDLLTPAQKETVDHHRYISDMMTIEEEYEYEHKYDM